MEEHGCVWLLADIGMLTKERCDFNLPAASVACQATYGVKIQAACASVARPQAASAVDLLL